MPVATKMRPIEIHVRIGRKKLRFEGVPESKLKPILISLKEYEKETLDWRDLAQERISEAGGEGAYMVKSARKAAGLTQAELAAKLDMPQGNVSQIESGKRPIGKNLAKKLAKIFKLDYRVFL